GGPQTLAGPQHDLTNRAAGQADAEQLGQDGRDLGVRQTELLVEQDGGGLGLRSDLAGGGAGGVGSLQRMAAADGPVAALAAATVDVDLTAQRLAGQVDLELAVDMGWDEVAEAMGAAGRQGRLDAFVNGAVGR